MLTDEPTPFLGVPFGRSREELLACSSEGILLRLISEYQTEVLGDNHFFILASWPVWLVLCPAAVGRNPKPPYGSCTGCLVDERTLDTNVLGRSCYKFHFGKMRKPSLPRAIRMLVYSGLGPCQCFHMDGRGPFCSMGSGRHSRPWILLSSP